MNFVHLEFRLWHFIFLNFDPRINKLYIHRNINDIFSFQNMLNLPFSSTSFYFKRKILEGSHEIHIFDDEAFLKLATVAVLTEKSVFLFLSWQPLWRKQIILSNSCNLSTQTFQEKWSLTDKDYSRKLSQSCIPYPIAKDTLLRTLTLSMESKRREHFFFGFYYILSYVWVDLTYLTCLIFPQPPW